MKAGAKKKGRHEAGLLQRPGKDDYFFSAGLAASAAALAAASAAGAAGLLLVLVGLVLQGLVLARAEDHEYLVDYTLQELEQRLPEGQFVRVHRGAVRVSSEPGRGTTFTIRFSSVPAGSDATRAA